MPQRCVDPLQEVGVHLRRGLRHFAAWAAQQYFADVAEDRVRPAFEFTHVAIGHTQHVRDHRHRQRNGELGDEIRLVQVGQVAH